MLSLFPTAIICVNESEVDVYKDSHPDIELLVHPDMPLIETKNWMLDNIQTPCIVQFSDDIKWLQRICPPQKRIRDSRTILQVIENAVITATDLDVSIFGWTINTNYTLLHPEVRPFRSCAPCSAHALGIRGASRNRKFEHFIAQADFDYTLQAMLIDRCIQMDVRFSFQTGEKLSGGNRGGNTGQYTSEQFLEARERLFKKWGRYAGESRSAGFTGARRDYMGMSIRVERLSSLATR
jgi:hypothetical protein